MIRSLVFAAAMMVATTSSYATEYINNGTFSQPVQYSTSQPGWTATTQSYGRPGSGSNIYFQNNTAYVLLYGYKATLSQQISGATGALTLSFDLTTDHLGPGYTQSVEFNGISLVSLTDTTPHSIHYSFDVVGTGLDTLQFITDATLRNGSVAIHNVSLVTRAVPEPTTYGMMVSGLGLLGLIARRKNRAQV